MFVLVGNGPSVMLSKNGPLIDAADCVVRFNLYVLRPELAEWTGTRTDVWAVNKGYCDGEFRDPVPKPPKVLIAVPWEDGQDPSVWKRCAAFCRDSVEIVPETVARRMTQKFGVQKWPSTGAMALAHYAELGPVTLLGFDCFQAACHHYADDNPFCGHHSGDAEQAFVNELVRSGRVKLV